MTINAEDERLLALLKANAREPVASLARKLGVARTTVQERIRRLERQGVIAGYTVQLNEAFAANRIKALVAMSAEQRRAESVVRALKAIPGVTAVYSVSGIFDLIAVIVGNRIEDIDQTVDRVSAVPGIERTETSLVLSTKFER